MRRPTVVLTGVVLVGIAASAFVLRRAPAEPTPEGTLSFTPHAPSQTVAIGLAPLGFGAERDGFLFVPHGNDASHPAPLLILLHGATQRARLFERITPVADSAGVVILAPDSRGYTWDAVRDAFGPDVKFLDRSIMRAFDRAYIDTCRVVLGGFSDGASYALSLGIRNARQLRGVVAFSPGFVIPAREIGRLPIFVRHGTRDQILPIDHASRPIVSALRAAGFTVDYAEFDGPHTVRPDDARDALDWVKQRSCGAG
jgi:phospholipase/carboxylesterase